MNFEKPYIENIQKLLDSLTDSEINKTISETMNRFEKHDQEWIEKTYGLISMKLTLIDKKKRVKMTTNNVYKELLEEREGVKKLFKKNQLKDIFLIQTYFFVLYCKMYPQDALNVFGLKA